MFLILEDIIRKSVEFAPQKWVKKDENGVETVYWPKNNIKTLQVDANSEPIQTGQKSGILLMMSLNGGIFRRWKRHRKSFKK